MLPALNQTASEPSPTFATIAVDRIPIPATTDSMALKPKAVVTIAFLSN